MLSHIGDQTESARAVSPPTHQRIKRKWALFVPGGIFLFVPGGICTKYPGGTNYSDFICTKYLRTHQRIERKVRFIHFHETNK